MRIWFLIAVAALPAFAHQSPATFSGQVLDASSGQPLPNVNILVSPGSLGTSTDAEGMFRIPLSPGSYQVEVRHLGYVQVFKGIELAGAEELHIVVKLLPKPLETQAVTVYADNETYGQVERLDNVDIKRMPTVYSDVLRTVKILPGVMSNNEMTSAYNVRGGNHDENLIYLNGYEIYRPALLRQGVAENQSLVNPDLVASLRFFGGGFPARLGNKLTSALEVDYRNNFEPHLHAVVRGDMLNFGLALRNRIDRFNWTVAGRFSDPSLFVDKLQTTGSYRPRFADVQALFSYAFKRGLTAELFLVTASNNFDLTPAFWHGNFGGGLFVVRGVDIEWDGKREYSFLTNLVGLSLKKRLAETSFLQLRVASYNTNEDDQIDLNGDVYYVRDSRKPDENRTYLKSRAERANNRFDVNSYHASATVTHAANGHVFEAGIAAQSAGLESVIDEITLEFGNETIQEDAVVVRASQSARFSQFNAYAQDEIEIAEKWRLGLGMRALHYAFTGENLFSPRGNLRLMLSENDQFSLATGLYYQPPFYHEIRDKTSDVARRLRSQSAAHMMLDWQHRFKSGMQLKVEPYYKRLRDIIPYYREQLRLIYASQNSHEGYAYGFDLLLRGEIVKGVNSWLSYGYLNTREREKGSGTYRRRLLDQTHTFRFFLQDKMPRFPNMQSHMRVLFGSGFLYHPRRAVTDSLTGETVLKVDFERQEKFKYYFRLDLGLSARFKFRDGGHLLLTAEILNAWNVVNVADYTWFHIPEISSTPRRIPQVLTKRFFNVGAELSL